MGLFSGIGIASFMLLVSGLITTSSLVTGVIYSFNKFEDYSCGKLNYGILIGVATLIPLLFNFMLYAISCIKKISLILPLFLVMCSSALNIYFTDNLSHKCLDRIKKIIQSYVILHLFYCRATFNYYFNNGFILCCEVIMTLFYNAKIY